MDKLVLIMYLVFFLLGFFAGRSLGYKKGWISARAEYPVELKQKALDEGLCPVCQAKNEQKLAGNNKDL